MKFYDCFTFFNELDILEVRLEYLYNHVDFFVIVESDHTHTAKPKEFIFEDNKNRFQKYLDKIIYIKQKAILKDSFSDFAKEYSPKDEYWKLENDQRNSISRGLSEAKPNDIIMISDVDEIPNVEKVNRLNRILLFNKKVTFNQQLHLYYVNCLAKGKEQKWNGTVACKLKNIQAIQSLRNGRHYYKQIKNGGWHLSYLGGIDSIIQKIESFAHTELNQDRYKVKDRIMLKIKNGTDIYDREGHYTEIINKENINMDVKLLNILQRKNHFFLKL